MNNIHQILSLVKNKNLKSISKKTKKEINYIVKTLNKNTSFVIKNKNIVCYFFSFIDNVGINKKKGIGADHLNLNKVNYIKTIKYSIEQTVKNSDCIIYVFFDKNIKLKINSHRVILVPLVLNINEPMYNRVKVFNAFVNSNLFTNRTIFLDIDAYINRKDVFEIFDLNFDIALTYRDSKNVLMPINEGVIFLKKSKYINLFFLKYLCIYENLLSNDNIKKLYPNLKFWRGGQLSLNSLTDASMYKYTYNDTLQIQKNKIYFLPCEDYNFTPKNKISNFNIDKAYINKYIIHLKGAVKNLIT